MAIQSSSRPKEVKLFRNNRSQAVRIPVEFEMPGDRVLIHREGDKLIIEPVKTPENIRELLAHWRQDEPIGVDDDFPDLEDPHLPPENVF
jgi:antitoxin VapB